MKKVYLVYSNYCDGSIRVEKVFLNKENAKNYVTENNKFSLEIRGFCWGVEMEVADYSETIQNDGKF